VQGCGEQGFEVALESEEGKGAGFLVDVGCVALPVHPRRCVFLVRGGRFSKMWPASKRRTLAVRG